METFHSNIVPGRQLRAARTLDGLKQKQLAQAVGVRLSSTNLSCDTGTATSCLLTSRKPPALILHLFAARTAGAPSLL
jgi:hypothetical protein